MDVTVPKLGEGADSGIVVGVLVKEGDQVTEGQTVIELENEKAVAPIPSPASGTVAKIRVKEGDKISVGQIILTLGDSGRAGTEAAKESAVGETPAPKIPDRAGAEKKEDTGEMAPARPEAGIAAGPAVRKLSRELGIDLTRVRGSEAGGRVLMADVRAYLQRLQKIEGRTGNAAPAEAVDFSRWGPISKKPLSQLRKVIGRRMSESWASVPRVTQFDEADITALMESRKRHQAAYEADGARLTLTPITLKALVAILKKHPIFNASLDEAAGEIVFKEYYHIGVAVDTDAGLLVPVVRDVDRKTVLQLAKEVEDLASRARERKLSPDEMKGGTFTISNQGGIGGGHFTPIVNKPEVAILGLGRGELKAVVKDKQIVQRLMLPVAVSYDHRVIDGGAAARFTTDLVRTLEDFPEDEIKI
jgi:pyruvate dehydrogenase E2 component (dihydrolipoamide acetyltransferase)